MKLHPSIGARIRVITDDYSHETHEKTRNIIYIIVLGLSRRSPAGVQVLWPLWARGQIQESLLSALSFPNPQSTITVLSFPPSAFRLPTSFLFLLSFPLSALRTFASNLKRSAPPTSNGRRPYLLQNLLRRIDRGIDVLIVVRSGQKKHFELGRRNVNSVLPHSLIKVGK